MRFFLGMALQALTTSLFMFIDIDLVKISAGQQLVAGVIFIIIAFTRRNKE